MPLRIAQYEFHFHWGGRTVSRFSVGLSEWDSRGKVHVRPHWLHCKRNSIVAGLVVATPRTMPRPFPQVGHERSGP